MADAATAAALRKSSREPVSPQPALPSMIRHMEVGNMVVNRIHAGPVVFARILAASQAPLRTQSATRESSRSDLRSNSAGDNPQSVDGRNHLVKRFHQWHLYFLLRGSF